MNRLDVVIMYADWLSANSPSAELRARAKCLAAAAATLDVTNPDWRAVLAAYQGGETIDLSDLPPLDSAHAAQLISSYLGVSVKPTGA